MGTLITPTRRRFLGGASAAGFGLLAAPALRANNRPSQIVVAGLQIGWKRTFEEEIAPKFEQETGIKVVFEWLPIDALAAKLKTQMSTGAIDVGWFNTGNANALSRDFADHEALFAEYGAADDYKWDDIFASAKSGYTVGGKLCGVPFRFTTHIMHYQPDHLEAAGITKAPETFEEYRNAGLAVTEKFGGSVFGVGMYGRESEAMVRGWNSSFMLSNGGRYYDLSNYEILVNKAASVDSLQFYADMLVKDKIVPPEALTWEWDGLVSGAQADRYAMTCTIGPYATLMNDPKLSKTAGKWAWAKVPGGKTAADSLSSTGGWAMGVPEASKNREWAFEFIKMATTTAALKSTTKDGNAPPRATVLNDPDVVQLLGWAPAFSAQGETAISFPTADDPVFTTCDQQIRPHMSRVLLGTSTAQEAMDAAAKEWERTIARANVK